LINDEAVERLSPLLFSCTHHGSIILCLSGLLYPRINFSAVLCPIMPLLLLLLYTQPLHHGGMEHVEFHIKRLQAIL
jgi:hypothetical protein